MKTPTMLYKYKGFNQNSLEMLLSNKIYCASPLSFNDPLDCSPKIRVDLCDTDSNYTAFNFHYENVKRQTQSIFDGYPLSESIRGLLDNFYISKAEELASRDEMNALVYGREDDLSSALVRHFNPGVFSLSTKNNCPLMWSHYSDEHNGYCFGYEINSAVSSKIHRIAYNNTNDGISLSEVLSMLENGNKSKEYRKIFKLALLTKTTEWKYESEWRYINDRVGLISVPMNVKEVYFGFRFKKVVREMIMKSLEGRDIIFYEVVRKNGDNTLTFNKLC